MPYRWTAPSETKDQTWRLCLWPYRSLSPKGFVTFFAITAALLLMPLIAGLGTPVLWGLLPFVLGVVWLTWHFIDRNYRDAELREDLTLWPDQMELIRTSAKGAPQNWQANPYWVRVEMHPKSGPVANYVTLTGAGRAVEIGAFLSADERVTLFHELQDRLRALDINAH